MTCKKMRSWLRVFFYYKYSREKNFNVNRQKDFSIKAAFDSQKRNTKRKMNPEVNNADSYDDIVQDSHGQNWTDDYRSDLKNNEFPW